MSDVAVRPRPLIPEWTFGDRVRKARRSAGLSQQELADALAVKLSRLASWESGKANPRQLQDIARRVEDVTGVPALWLLGFTPEPVIDAAGVAVAGVQNWKVLNDPDESRVVWIVRRDAGLVDDVDERVA